MINSKHLNKIVLAFVIMALLVCVMIVYLAQVNAGSKEVAYQSKLFGDEVVAIDITVDQEDWQGLLDNPMAKEYIVGDLTINGETFTSVGLRTKGNSSLTQVAQTGSDRYSIHFKFDQYQKGQTYYGLDAFCINNLMGDNTYMKDYLSYEIMDFIGVPSPLKNYAKVTVNGEDFGFYVALERYEKSFLDRAYDTSGGQLYNVKIQMGQRDQFMPTNLRQNTTASDKVDIDASGGLGGTRGGKGAMDGGRGIGGMGSGRRGGDLVYTDDSIDSYSSIFDNAEFKACSDKDKERAIKALKNLSEGTDLDQYFDVDEILRYLAAHTVVVNLDSYSSSMAQNYYIYEKDGKISILPWDYGLSFGGFHAGNAEDTINFPIDTPVSRVSMEERPLISKLLEVSEYKEKYHEYLNEIVEGYFHSGLFEETITVLDAKINEYVKNDSTSFITYEKYSASLPVLKELGTLRAQSIESQLKGTIPSTTEGQSADKSSLISGEGIDLTALGTFMNGGGVGGMGRGMSRSNMPDMSDMVVITEITEIISILVESGGQVDEETHDKLVELGLDDEQIDMIEDLPINVIESFEGGVEMPAGIDGQASQERPSGMGGQGGRGSQERPSDMGGQGGQSRPDGQSGQGGENRPGGQSRPNNQGDQGEQGEQGKQEWPGEQGDSSGNFPGEGFDNWGNFPDFTEEGGTGSTKNTDYTNIILSSILLLIMIVATIFVWRYERKY